MSLHRPERSKGRLWLAYALAITAIVSIAHYTGTNASEFLGAVASIRWPTLAFATAFFALHLGLNAAAFAQVTDSLGYELGTTRLARFWLASLAAKYIPGGVWHVVGRGFYLTRHGVSVREVVAVGAFEQAHSLLLCTGIALAFFGLRLDHAGLTALGVILPVAGVFGLLATSRWLGITVVSRQRVWVAALVYGLSMLPYASAYVLLCIPADTMRFIESLFSGTVAGVLAVPVPGGIGIRESVTAYLTDARDAGRLLAGLLAARVILLVLEVGATLVAQSVWWPGRGRV